MPQPDGGGEYVHRPHQGGRDELEADEQRGGEDPHRPGHPRQPQAAAGLLLHRRAADGGHRPGGGYGVQGAHSG